MIINILNILTTDVVTSSAIEGEHLDTDEVRSSIARRLGIPLQNDKPVGRDIEGIVEMMLDATQLPPDHGRRTGVTR